MGLPLKKLLELPILKTTTIIAGHTGLNRIVETVSVLEYTDLTFPTPKEKESFIEQNELVISAFNHIKNDPPQQLQTIQYLHDIGEAGLVLYYVGTILKTIEQPIIDLADRLAFPILIMPNPSPPLRYSDLIQEVAGILVNTQNKPQATNKIIEQVLMLPEYEQNMDQVLKILSSSLQADILLTDTNYQLLSQSLLHADEKHFSYNDCLINYQQIHPFITRDSWSFPINNSNTKVKAFSFPISTQKLFNQMGLFIFSHQQSIDNKRLQQAVDIIQFFNNIWGGNFGRATSAELVKAILNDESLKIKRLSDFLNIDISSINSMWLLDTHKNTQKNRLITQLKEILPSYFRNFLMDFYQEQLIILTDESFENNQNINIAKQVLEQIEHDDILLICALGLEKPLDVQEAHTLIMNCLADAKVVYPKQQILSLAEMRFIKNCQQIFNQGEKAIQQKTRCLQPLQNEPELLKTLTAHLLDSQMHNAKTATQLFVHKNTIKYRINRINELLQFDLVKKPENYELYCAVALHRMLNTIF